MDKKSKFPWVFWLSISWRPNWFKYFWSTRGANFYELQIWKFKVSIGRPWILDVIHNYRKDYGTLNHVRETNRLNLKRKASLLIGNKKWQNG